MPRAYVPLRELVDAFFENGSRTRGYVWRAIAEHDAAGCWEWSVNVDHELVQWPQRVVTRLPEDTFEHEDSGETLQPGTTGIAIRLERDGWMRRELPENHPGLEGAVTLAEIQVWKPAILRWCEAFRVTPPPILMGENEKPPQREFPGPLQLDDLPDDLRKWVPDYEAVEGAGGGTVRANAKPEAVEAELARRVTEAKAKGWKLPSGPTHAAVADALKKKVTRELWRPIWAKLTPDDWREGGRNRVNPAVNPAENPADATDRNAQTTQ